MSSLCTQKALKVSTKYKLTMRTVLPLSVLKIENKRLVTKTLGKDKEGSKQ